MKTSVKTVLAAVEAFLERHEMAHTTFGMKALGNPSFVNDLRKGKVDPRASTVEKLYAWMKEQDMEATFGYGKK